MIKGIIVASVLIWSALIIIVATMADRIYKRLDDLGLLTKNMIAEVQREMEQMSILQKTKWRQGEMILMRQRQMCDIASDIVAEVDESTTELKEIILQTMAPVDPWDGDAPDLAGGEIVLPEVPIDDKAAICSELKRLLQMTRAGEDITDITYEKVTEKEGFTCEEYAVITWASGHKQSVSITADSGKAIIADVLRWV